MMREVQPCAQFNRARQYGLAPDPRNLPLSKMAEVYPLAEDPGRPPAVPKRCDVLTASLLPGSKLTLDDLYLAETFCTPEERSSFEREVSGPRC
jgi:hypothetical protein